MAAQSLDDLRTKLIFQNSMDVWIVLCREKGWDRRDYSRYTKFIAYLRENRIELKKALQGHPMKDSEGKPIETYTIKLDVSTIEKIRAFI